MAQQRRLAGTMYFKVDGKQYPAKGNFTYNLGRPKREAEVGVDAIHGYTEKPQVPFIEGEITDTYEAPLKDLLDSVGGTVTLELANGKVIALQEAWYAHEGTVETETAKVPVRFEGIRADEIA